MANLLPLSTMRSAAVARLTATLTDRLRGFHGRSVVQTDVRDCVEAAYPAALDAGFSSEADVGLYCLFRYLATYRHAGAVGGDLLRFVEDTTVDVDERRYRLKAHLDRTRILPFGAHESIVTTEAAP